LEISQDTRLAAAFVPFERHFVARTINRRAYGGVPNARMDAGLAINACVGGGRRHCLDDQLFPIARLLDALAD
jgi:hypothetical protein